MKSSFPWKGVAALVIAGALIVVVISTGSLVIGYIGATLLLCAFLLAVAFDIGLPKTQVEDQPAEDAPVAARRRSRNG